MRRRYSTRLWLRRLEDRITPTVNWTGNAGNSQWQSPNNWNPVGVPGSGADVVINANVNVFYTGVVGTTIHSLNIQGGAFLYVDANSIGVTAGLTVNPTSALYARNAGSSFTASGATTINGGLVYAQSNASVTLNGLAAIMAIASCGTRLEADGGGTLSVPSLMTITGTNSTQLVQVEATGASTVTMNGVTTLNSGSTQLEATGASSVINADALKTVDFNTASDSYGNLYATGGGQLNVSAMLTKVNHINLNVDGAASFPTSQLTDITLSTVYVYGGNPSFANVTTMTGSNFYAQGSSTVTFTSLASETGSALNNTYLEADNSSLLSFPALTTVNLNTSNFTYISALSGSTLTLGALTTLNTGYVDLRADGAGSQLNMPMLGSITFPAGSSHGNIAAQNGGQMAVSVDFKVLNTINFHVDTTNAFPVGQLTNSNASNIYVTGGQPVFTNFTKFDAPAGYNVIQTDGAGTVASFPVLATFTPGTSNYYVLQAYSGSELSAPAITSFTGGASLQANGAGSVLDLPGLAAVSSGGIDAQNGGKINTGSGLITLDSESIYLDSTTGFPVGQLTSITNSNVYLQGGSPTFTNLASASNCYLETDNAGTAASFPAMTSFISNPATTLTSLVAYSGSMLTAGALTTLNSGSVRLRAQGPGSVINLSALTSIVFPNVGGNQTYGDIFAQYGGRVKVAAGLTTLDYENLTQDTTAGFPDGQLKSITNSNIYLQGGSSTFTKLTTASNCNFEADYAGTMASFPAMTSFISNPATTTTSLLAYSGATLSAAALTTLNTGNVSLEAQNTTGTVLSTVLSLPALSSIVFPNVGGNQTYGSINASGGGQIQVATGLTTLDQETFSQDTTAGFPDGQLTSISNSTVNLIGSPTFTKLTTATNCSIQTNAPGTAASFPALTSFISNPVSTFSSLAADGGSILTAAALTTLNSGNNSLYAQYNGVLNLPALTSIVFPNVGGYQTSGYIYAQYGGQIKVAAGLTTLDYENLTQDTTAGFPDGQLTSITNSCVYLKGGSPTFTKLASTTNVRLESDNAGTVASFPALTNFITISGTSYLVANVGGKLSAAALTTINTGTVRVQAVNDSGSPNYTPSIIDLPALTTFTPPVNSTGYLYSNQGNTQINTAPNLHLANLNFTFDNNAKFNFSNLQLDSTVTTTGYGKLPGNVTNDGLIDLKYNDTSSLEVSGNFKQTSAGTLVVDLGGNTQGSSYDWLKVDATIQLGGTVTVRLLNGLTPALNDSFVTISGTSRSGTFVNYNIPNNPGPLEFPLELSPTYNGTSFILTAALPTRPYVSEVTPTGTVLGAVTQTIVVTYNDDVAIDVSSIGTGDLSVNGPNGFTAVPTLVSVDSNVNGTPRVATYQFTAPGGSWDYTDNGAYVVSMNGGEVLDTDNPAPDAVRAGMLLSINVALPRVIVVDSVIDENDGNIGPGNLSLREAIGLANATVNSAPDSITFDPTVFATPQTIMLTLGELAITHAVTIAGPPSGLTIDANQSSRIFNIDAPGESGQTVAISAMTLTNGNSPSGNGGAIRDTDEALVLTGVTINNCSTACNGGAVSIEFKEGSLALSDSELTGNAATGSSSQGQGGAIYVTSSSVVSLVRCTVANNQAGFSGGGVAFSAGGSLAIYDSTLSGNTAGEGGALSLVRVAATIRNSTISGNSAAYGGAISDAGTHPSPTLTIQNSTIAFNSATTDGGGILWATGFLTLVSTIVAKNTATSTPDISGPATMNFSLLGNSSGATITGANNVLNVDPMLGPLADNGGPTLTHALMLGSPAINVGSNPALLTIDQRGAGFARVVGKAADIGAFEVQVLPPSVASVVINDGSAQRSRVTSVTVNFDQPVTLPANPADAFTLKRQSDNMLVTLSAAVTGNAVTLTFTGGPVQFGSLADGRYTLTALAARINGGYFDGNGDSVVGDDYVLASAATGNPPTNIFRFYGDIDGNGSVDASDFVFFRQSFNGVNGIFDFDGDGFVSTSDFIQFRNRFNTSI
jgi:hypothetical protein